MQRGTVVDRAEAFTAIGPRMRKIPLTMVVLPDAGGAGIKTLTFFWN